MIKTIIFDLGSVVVHVDWLGINKEFMEKFGISTLIYSEHEKEIKDLYGKLSIGKGTMEEFFREVCKSKGLNLDSKLLSNFYMELYKKYKKIDNDMVDLIKKLRKRYKVVCVTDTNHLHYETHREQGILDLFDEKFGSHELGFMKKDKDAFKIILQKIKSKPEETL